MAGWNLALRFGLELGALAALGAAAWRLTSGPMRWVAVIVVPVVAAILWGVFNVVDDPSRSGAAPVEVPGWARLTLELMILTGGAIALAIAGRRGYAIGFGVLVALQYLTSWSRIEWLVQA